VSGTGSSPKTELASALHRLRSTLARLKAELELAEEDGTAAPPAARLLGDVSEALAHLAAAEAAVGDSVRVLVVDDDLRLAEITVRALRRRGFEAEAGAAVRLLTIGEVLVVDLGLLQGASEATLDEVRAARPIVVTGGTDGASRLLAQRIDARAYLVKPVDVDALARTIRSGAAADE
jgi:CheY-like chemotaxis protein